MMRLSTWAIPGAFAAARSADSRCSQVPTAPVKVAVSPDTVTVIVTGIHVGVLVQCLDDPVSYVADRRSGRHGDVVQHAAYAANVAHGVFGALLLKQPIHVPVSVTWPVCTTTWTPSGIVLRSSRAPAASWAISGSVRSNRRRTSTSFATARTPCTRLAARSAASLPE